MSSDTETVTEKHPVDQALPFPQMFTYGLQHVLSMYAGVVAVPLIVGTALKLSRPEITYLVSAGLFMSGLATLLQTIGVWKFGARQPIVQGTSFAAVSTILAIGTAQGGVAGLREVFGALLVAGILGFLIAPVFTRLLRFFPEVVTGSGHHRHRHLAAARGHAVGRRRHAGRADFGDPQNIALAAITMAIIVLIYRFLPGGFGRVAILLGPGARHRRRDPVRDDQLQPDRRREHLPADAAVPLRPADLRGRRDRLHVHRHAGDHDRDDRRHPRHRPGHRQARRPADRHQRPAGRHAVDQRRAVFNGFSVSAFAQNVGLVAITGIKSRFVVAVGGGILVFLGLFPILGALVALVPLPVLGGAGLALFGTVAASGIRTLSKVDFSGNANLVIVAFSIGMGVIPIAVPTFYDKFPEWFQVIFDSGITAAALTAVLLNIVFNIIGRKEEAEGPIFAEAPAPAAISEEDEARLDPEGPAARGRSYEGQPVSYISAHVLDASAGIPARGSASAWPTGPGRLLAEAVTDADGRVGDLGPDRLDPGTTP